MLWIRHSLPFVRILLNFYFISIPRMVFFLMLINIRTLVWKIQTLLYDHFFIFFNHISFQI